MLAQPYFKLICGASLRHADEIRRLSHIYAQAGAHIVDVAADPSLVKAALQGIGEAPALVMVSVAVQDDPHLLVIQKTDCSDCEKCLEHCEGLKDSDRCVGCGKCLELCPSLTLVRRQDSPQLEACWEAGARGLELHTGGGDPAELESWRETCQDWVKRGGLFSCSVNARQLPLREACALAQTIKGWFDTPIILQADGNPLSGHDATESTLPALEFAKHLIESGLEAWIQPAGGANADTGRLAAKKTLAIAGVGMGSVARQAVQGLAPEDAIKEAKRLVESVFPPKL